MNLNILFNRVVLAGLVITTIVAQSLRAQDCVTETAITAVAQEATIPAIQTESPCVAPAIDMSVIAQTSWLGHLWGAVSTPISYINDNPKTAAIVAGSCALGYFAYKHFWSYCLMIAKLKALISARAADTKNKSAHDLMTLQSELLRLAEPLADTQLDKAIKNYCSAHLNLTYISNDYNKEDVALRTQELERQLNPSLCNWAYWF